MPPTLQRSATTPPTAPEHIGVVLRLRPQSKKERADKVAKAVRAHGDRALLVEGVPKPIRCTAAFDEMTDQRAFFERCGVTSLLEAVLDGYRATAFAYGQTGSGKTYTMFGGDAQGSLARHKTTSAGEHDGMLPRALSYLFERMRESGGRRFRARVTCLEIYREVVRDLLLDGGGEKIKKLQVREHPKFGFFVEGLKVVGCPSAAKAKNALARAVARRQVGAHKLNDTSSRSHAIITIYIDAEPLEGSSGAAKKQTYGAVSFVDLAGSERPKLTKSVDSMLQDAGHINKSLYTLGKVIRGLEQLATRPAASSTTIVPFRDSQLTKLLIASLGGHCKTIMVGCCSCSASSLDETLRTLDFASRVRGIQNKPRVQHDPHKNLIDRLKDEIATLRRENDLLRQQAAARDRPADEHDNAISSYEDSYVVVSRSSDDYKQPRPRSTETMLPTWGGSSPISPPPLATSTSLEAFNKQQLPVAVIATPLRTFGDNAAASEDTENDESLATSETAYSLLMSSFSRANISLPDVERKKGRPAAKRDDDDDASTRRKNKLVTLKGSPTRRRRRRRSPNRSSASASSASSSPSRGPSVVSPFGRSDGEDDEEDAAQEDALSDVFARAMSGFS